MLRPQPTLEEQQQILLDTDFDSFDNRPHWVEQFLSRQRDMEQLDTLGY